MAGREPLDIGRYTRVPLLDVATMLAFGIRLLAIVPKSSAPRDEDELKRIRPPARALRVTLVTLKDSWRAGDAVSAPKRPLDIAFDAAWGALLARLEPWSIFASVPGGTGLAKLASALVATIFSSRLDFTRLELNAEWAQSQKRLDVIAEKALRDDLVKTAGAEFVERVEETHAALGRALGLDGGAPDPEAAPAVDMLVALRAVHQAIGAYVLQLLAADATGSDALSAQIRASLAIVDEFRAIAATHPSDAPSQPVPAPAVDPETPVPLVPDDDAGPS
jgi:hypothetical protein